MTEEVNSSNKELKIPLPFHVNVRDYHDFDTIRELIEELSGTSKLKFEEVGLDGEGSYVGVFYTNKNTAKSLIKQLKKQIESEGGEVRNNL